MTREEAIKELRGFIGQLTEGCQEAIKVLIPELRESEDERIRKAVLKGIEYLEMDEGWDSIGDIDILDAKQWLEKQKESLHISETCKENTDSFTDEDEDRTINGCLLAANAERRCKRASEELLEELGLADYTKFFYEQGVEKGKKEREKQKEQKPAGWSNGVKERLDDISEYLSYYGREDDSEFLQSLYPQPKQEWGEEEALNRTYEEGFNDGLKYRKPVKRSDEDKKMSNWLIGLVNANTELSFKNKVNLTRWLEHLTIEKELPKNDKRIMDAIMIGYQDKDFRSSQIPTPIGVSKDEVIDWLKSLRPPQYCENCKLKRSVENWKPSKEQMGALNYAYCELFKRGDVDHNILGPLQNLIDTLRKL